MRGSIPETPSRFNPLRRGVFGGVPGAVVVESAPVVNAKPPSLIVYPGSFDPLTLGHLDLLERASGIFDRVILAVAAGSWKPGALFSCAERVEMAREAAHALGNVEVRVMEGMLVDFCHAVGARVVLRGLRAYSDFEYEFQMALTNRKLAPDIETFFLMPREDHSYVSSSIVREIASYAGDTSRFVPPEVQRHIERKVVLTRLEGKGRAP